MTDAVDFYSLIRALQRGSSKELQRLLKPPPQEQGIPPDIEALLSKLPEGQLRVVKVLLRVRAPMYPDVADSLGIILATAHIHLRRIRGKYPDIYAAIMEQRRWGLAQRHEETLKRAAAHTGAYFRKMKRRGYTYYGRGVWLP